MRPRHRESESVLVGMLLLYGLVFFLSTGCSGGPTGCPPDFRAGGVAQDDVGRLETVVPGWDNQPGTLGFNPFCIAFPIFCQPYTPPEPMDPIYCWGGPDFTVTPKQVPLLARWHNDCLSAWRNSPHTAEALLATMDSVATAAGLEGVMDEESRATSLELFQFLLDDELDASQLPSHADLMAAWAARPLKGPFAEDPLLEELLRGLRDGISAGEVEDWRAYALGKQKAPVREYWVAACMAASVEWWHAFGEEVGEDCSAGVLADLAALIRTQDWRIVAIASLAGALEDVLDHFWPQE